MKLKGNHICPQPVTPVYNRKVARNKLKRANGSNRIQKAWRRSQIKKCGGIKQYIKMRLSKVANGKGRELLIKLYSELEG